jgi:hypothetical protein
LGNRTFFVPVGAAFAPFVGDTFTTNNRNVQMVKVGVKLSLQLGRTGCRQILIAKSTFDVNNHKGSGSRTGARSVLPHGTPRPFSISTISGLRTDAICSGA